jgi:hypothetical protein
MDSKIAYQLQGRSLANGWNQVTKVSIGNNDDGFCSGCFYRVPVKTVVFLSDNL